MRITVKNMNNRNYILASAAAVVIILAWIFYPSSNDSIGVYTVTRGPFSIQVTETGEIRATNSFTVTSPRLTSGGNLQIVELAPEGTIADSNQVLARFDPSSALKRIGDKQTDLKSALADLDKLRAQQQGDESQAETEFETAKLNFKLAEIARNKMEFEPEAKKRESELEFERAKLTFQQAEMNLKNKRIVRRSELNNLQLRISQIRSDLGVSTKELEQLTVRAPLSGLIVYLTNWSTGRKIAKGDQPWPGMPLISLPDLSSMQTEVSVNEMDISRIKKGLPVEIVPDAFPDRKFTGSISSVSQIGHQKSSGSNIKVFDVIVDVDSTDEVLKPGITVMNRILVETVKDVLSIPLVSVYEDADGTFVYLRSGSGFDKRVVKLGQRNDTFVVVLEGLEEGDEVALDNPEDEKPADAAGTSVSPPSMKPDAK